MAMPTLEQVDHEMIKNLYNYHHRELQVAYFMSDKHKINFHRFVCHALVEKMNKEGIVLKVLYGVKDD